MFKAMYFLLPCCLLNTSHAVAEIPLAEGHKSAQICFVDFVELSIQMSFLKHYNYRDGKATLVTDVRDDAYYFTVSYQYADNELGRHMRDKSLPEIKQLIAAWVKRWKAQGFQIKESDFSYDVRTY